MAISVDVGSSAHHRKHGYTTFSAADLDKCTTTGEVYLCPQANVIRYGSNSSCLAAIYENDPEETVRLCDLHVSRKYPFVNQISKSQFSIHTPEPKKMSVRCPTVAPATNSIVGTQLVYLDGGCVAELTDTIISGSPGTTGPREQPTIVEWGRPLPLGQAWESFTNREKREAYDTLVAGDTWHQVPLAAVLRHLTNLRDLEAMQRDISEKISGQATKMILNHFLPSASPWLIALYAILATAALAIILWILCAIRCARMACLKACSWLSPNWNTCCSHSTAPPPSPPLRKKVSMDVDLTQFSSSSTASTAASRTSQPGAAPPPPFRSDSLPIHAPAAQSQQDSRSDGDSHDSDMTPSIREYSRDANKPFKLFTGGQKL